MNTTITLIACILISGTIGHYLARLEEYYIRKKREQHDPK